MEDIKNEFILKQVETRLKLVEGQPIIADYPLSKPTDAIYAMREKLLDLDREHLCVINLDIAGVPLNYHVASIGNLSVTIMDPASVFKTAILSNAASIIMMHNHPSGNLSISSLDQKVTERMIGCGRLLGIQVVDHIVIGGSTGKFYSFRKSQPELFKKTVDYGFIDQFFLESEDLNAPEL